MDWAFFAILSVMGFAGSNLFDKYIMEKYLKTPISPLVFSCIFGLITAGIIYFIQGINPLPPFLIFLAFLNGGAYILGNIFYYHAIKFEEISKVIALFYLIPLFTAIFGFLFLNERFSQSTYIGIGLLILGAIFISIKDFKVFKLSKALWLMIIADIILAVSNILVKYVLQFSDVSTVYSYSRIGGFIAGLPIIYLYLPELHSIVVKSKSKLLVGLTGSELFAFIGLLFYTAANAAGSASLVSAISSIQPIFVLVFSGIITLFVPHAFKEQIHLKAVLQKGIAIALLVAGAILIT